MVENGRTIKLLNDVDGWMVDGPPPVRTTWQLARGKLPLPPESQPLEEYRPPEGTIGVLLGKLSILWHQIRLANPDAIHTIMRFQKIAQNYDRTMETGVLSGREQNKHKMTVRQLDGSVFSELLNDGFYLNNARSGSQWKAFIAGAFAEAGFVVVHFDDDLRAALRVARVNEYYAQNGQLSTLVYLKRNLSNSDLLLRRGGIELPHNVILFSDYTKAADDFEERLQRGEI